MPSQLAEPVHPPRSAHPFDPLAVRADFPILRTLSHGRPLVYLDNGATTQKPRQVIDAISRYYETANANIHRGVYDLSQRATEAYEAGRATVAQFINAPDYREVIFTRGTTEAINLVAFAWSRKFLRAGDEILVSAMEHHSNIVPWQLAAEAADARVRSIPMNDAGELMLDEYRKLLASGRVRMVSVVHLSNSLGTINDLKLIAALAHEHGAVCLSDGAQWVAHGPTDVQDLGVDFYCFSGHKLFGPTGIGVLWGRRALLESMPPYQGGGDMIETVSFDGSTYAPLPNKFEAGTPDIAGVVGLAAAVDYVAGVGFENFLPHEADLLRYATERLGTVPGLRVVGTARNKGSVVSFVLDDPKVETLDAGVFLDRRGVAVRTGHHCCMPVMARFCIPATTRASFAMYNTRADVDALVDALHALVDEKRAKATPLAASRTNAAPTAAAPTIEYPRSEFPTPQAAADDLADTFDLLGDRDARNEYVLDLGNKLPETFDLLKQVTPRVPGCMSEVYLIGRKSPTDAARFEFLADANADIVRGLIAILERVYSGHRAADVLAFDVESFFKRIGLDQFVTSQRSNGLAGMVNRIRTLAKEIA